MRPTCTLPVTCVLLAVACHATAPNNARGQENVIRKEIERTIGQFVTCMSRRDAEGLRAVLDTQFLCIEAGTPNAKAQVIDIDSAKEKELLPPQGNDDWDNVELSDVRAQTSNTHPSVASASFTLASPLAHREVLAMQKMLRDPPLELNDTQREAIKKRINAKCVTNSMFAVLAKREGRWRIMCMTFPK